VLIKDLETMEAIVQKNEVLSWDGWNVVELIGSSTAMLKKNGAYLRSKGAWFIKSVFVPSAEGWSVPNKYSD
jgi:hypothetical protein